MTPVATLPDSAVFCCGGLRALRQVARNTYGVFEYKADRVTASSTRHVCVVGNLDFAPYGQDDPGRPRRYSR